MLFYKMNTVSFLRFQCYCKHAKLLQLCLNLSYHMSYSPLGSSVHGILQAKTLEWVAMPFSRESSPARDRTHVSCRGRRVLYR